MTPLTRALTWSTAAVSMAKGVLFSVSALFFTTVIGLSPATVGLGLTVAGGAGMATAFGAGYLSDRIGAARVLLGATVVQAVALAAYCCARTSMVFVLIACLAVGAQGAQRTAQVTLVARDVTGADRVRTRARLRVVNNVFVGLGSAVAAVALGLGTAAAYLTAMLVAAVFVLGSALPLRALMTLPAPSVTPATGGTGRSALRDRRYLATAGLNGLITIQFGLLTVGVPLWVTLHTRAPAPIVAGLLVLNTTVVALGQVRAARRIRDVPSAGRAVFGATLLLLLACILYAGAALGGPVVAVAVLVAAVLAHSGGEIVAEAGGWELSFELADTRNPGAYQGVSQTGVAIGTMLAPAVVTATAITHGFPGWLLLGGLFVAAGAGTRAVSRAGRPKVTSRSTSSRSP